MDKKSKTVAFPVAMIGGILFGALIDNMGIGIALGLLFAFGILKWPSKGKD